MCQQQHRGPWGNKFRRLFQRCMILHCRLQKERRWWRWWQDSFETKPQRPSTNQWCPISHEPSQRPTIICCDALPGQLLLRTRRRRLPLACCAACSESVALCMPSSPRLHACACVHFIQTSGLREVCGTACRPALDSGCREKGFRKKGPAFLTCDHTAKKISQHTHTHRTAWGLGSKLKLKKQQLQLGANQQTFATTFPFT